MAEQNQNLQYAEQLLREGRKQEARTVLVEHVRGHASSTRGWWMLSFALTDSKQQIECVERVLRLDPNYAPARARLEKLKGNVFTQPSVSPFLDTPSSKPEIISAQPAKQNIPPPNAQKPGLSKKTNSLFLQYAVLAVMACMSIGVLGVATVLILRGNSNAPMQSVPPAQPLGITQISLPPTWTPTITATPPSTRTPFATDVPLATPTAYLLPTLAIPDSQIAPVKGSYAPDFKLTNVNDDQQVKLSNYRGKAVIVFFWATWCQYCKAEMPSLEMVYQAYKSQGLVVLAVDVGDSAAQTRSYRDAHALTFPVLNDASSEVASKYHISAFPSHFFVQPSGVITSVNVGALDYFGLNKKVRTMLNLAQ